MPEWLGVGGRGRPMADEGVSRGDRRGQLVVAVRSARPGALCVA